METRNITLNLPVDLIRKAKLHAAEHDTSMNAILRKLLEEAFNSEDRARAAADRILASAAGGPYFTVDHFTDDPGSIRREELHER